MKVKSDDQVVEKLTQLQDEEKALLKQLEQRDKEITSLKMGNIEDQVEEINGYKVLVTEVDVPNAKAIHWAKWMILNLNYKIQLSFLQVMLMIKYGWLQLSLNL